MRPSHRTALTVVVAAALVAAACSDPPTSGRDDARTGEDGDGATVPDCPLDALDDADGPVEVTLWYGGIGGVTQDTLVAIVDGFNASQDQVVLTASDQGRSFEEVYRKFESAASADPGQLPDLVMLENTQLQALADSGLVLPAEACMDAAGYDTTQIEPAVRAAYTVDDLLYPGYMNVSSQVLYYNKAHWLQAGLDPDAPPRTLEEVDEQARALRAAGVSNQPLSFKISTTVFENWLGGEGVDVVDNDNGHDGLATAATFDDPVAVDALAQLQQMNEDGLVNAFASTEGGIDQFLALVTEESSMLIETSTAASTIAQAVSGDLTPADAGIDFDASVVARADLVPGTAPLPGISGAGDARPGGSGFFIVSASEPAQQAGSWAVLEYMLDPATAKQWHLSGGYLPIVKSVLDEPDVEAFWQDDLAGVLLRPAVDQLRAADPDARAPLIGPHPDFADAVEAAVEGVLLDGQDPATALARAEDRVTASLQRYGQE